MNATDALVSVILPTRNRWEYLANTLETALYQTHPPLEVLVVDDGSTDMTEDLVRSYGERVRYFRTESVGPAVARNHALKEMRGDWAAFLDSDDLWAPRKLELQLKAIEKTDAGACFTNFRVIDDKGEVIDSAKIPFEYRYRGRFAADFLSGRLPIATSGVLIAREALEAEGTFDETLRFAEDFELWLRIGIHRTVAYVPDPVVDYRVHAGGLSNGKETEMWRAAAEVLTECRPELEERRVSARTYIARFYALAARAARRDRRAEEARRYGMEALRQDVFCLSAYKSTLLSSF